MDLMEYMAKEIFSKYDISIQKGFTADSVKEITSRAEQVLFPVVVKAQVQTGGRGKAGGVRFAESTEELEETAVSMFGMDIKGFKVEKLLIAEKVDISKEFYLSFILDTKAKLPVLIFSPSGGIDIEQTAKSDPAKVAKLEIDPVIGLSGYHIRYLIDRFALDNIIFAELFDITKSLYKVFADYNCMLAEINPLVLTDSGALMAIDGKITIDDNAVSKYPDIMGYKEKLNVDPMEKEAAGLGFLYIPSEKDGKIAVMSNGSGMLMSCMDLISKKGMKVGVAFDLGGGATSDRIREAVRIVFSNNMIDTVFISIFGGITRCDEVASGLKEAIKVYGSGKTVVVRLEGTNKEKGREVIHSIGGRITMVESITEGVEELYKGRVAR